MLSFISSEHVFVFFFLVHSAKLAAAVSGALLAILSGRIGRRKADAHHFTAPGEASLSARVPV